MGPCLEINGMLDSFGHLFGFFARTVIVDQSERLAFAHPLLDGKVGVE
jgi:hypothetical protein